jgi:hypothetical protein
MRVEKQEFTWELRSESLHESWEARVYMRVEKREFTCMRVEKREFTCMRVEKWEFTWGLRSVGACTWELRSESLHAWELRSESLHESWEARVCMRVEKREFTCMRVEKREFAWELRSESLNESFLICREVVFENANQQYTAAHKKKNIDRWGKEGTILVGLHCQSFCDHSRNFAWVNFQDL